MRIHGGLKQKKRVKDFEEFNLKETGVMFATDVIARGIDFPGIDLIIQIDPPQVRKYF